MSILHISPKVAEKLEAKHGIDPDEVRSAVVGVPGLPYSRNKHPQRGWRVYVFVEIDDEPVQVVLCPSRSGNPEEWHLGSAYPEWA